MSDTRTGVFGDRLDGDEFIGTVRRGWSGGAGNEALDAPTGEEVTIADFCALRGINGGGCNWPILYVRFGTSPKNLGCCPGVMSISEKCAPSSVGVKSAGRDPSPSALGVLGAVEDCVLQLVPA